MTIIACNTSETPLSKQAESSSSIEETVSKIVIEKPLRLTKDQANTLVELPLAIEENSNAATTIGRSWQLTKGSVGRIQLIVFLVFLICAPISIVSNVVGALLQVAIGSAMVNAPELAVLGGLFYLAFIFAFAALLLPIWQLF